MPVPFHEKMIGIKGSRAGGEMYGGNRLAAGAVPRVFLQGLLFVHNAPPQYCVIILMDNARTGKINFI